MRRFFLSERKIVQTFRSTKWLELLESEVLLTPRDRVASASLWKMGQSY